MTANQIIHIDIDPYCAGEIDMTFYVFEALELVAGLAIYRDRDAVFAALAGLRLRKVMQLVCALKPDAEFELRFRGDARDRLGEEVAREIERAFTAGVTNTTPHYAL